MRSSLGSAAVKGRSLRRLLLALLAGGGATAGALGGPLVGALGADPQPSEALTATTSETSSTSASTAATSASSSTLTVSGTTSATSSSTSTAPAETSSSSSTSSSTSTGAEAETETTATTRSRGRQGVSRHHHKGGRSRKRGSANRSQQSNGGTSSQGAGAPSAQTAPGPSNVAKPPELVGARTNLLAALTKGVAASAQAIDLFYRIPPFLLPIYQAAGEQYGVPWEVLAAINEVETDFGNDLSVSSAGAVGWMQFMPETWLQYGVDALNAGYADPYNPVDAIFAAARYLAAAGAATNLRAAIFAYNHSEAYVEAVLLRARLFASYPPSAVATLTGLADGVPPLQDAHVLPSSVDGLAFPVASASSSTPAPPPPGKGVLPEPTQLVEVEGAPGSPVVAVESGKVVALGHNTALGRYLVLEDVYGDLFTYANLGSLVHRYRLPGPQEGGVPLAAVVASSTASSQPPKSPASGGVQPPVTLQVSGGGLVKAELEEAQAAATGGGKALLYARPGNPDARAVESRLRSATAITGGWQRLRVGSVVAQGTVLGFAQPSPGANPGTVLRFAIRPAGDPAPINPEPVVANWEQLQRALHPQGAKGANPLLGATAQSVFLLSQSELERSVLADPGISLSGCERQAVAAGRVDGRVLATLLFLSRSGLKPTVGGLRCAQAGLLGTAPSAAVVHGVGVDIVAINGTPIAEHQGAGTVTDLAIRTLLTLQGRFAPQAIISLMRYPNAPATQAQASHARFIEVDFPPVIKGGKGAAGVASSVGGAPLKLTAIQWNQLIASIAALPQPTVPARKSSAAIPDRSKP